jgi:hypothetical protein
MDVSGKLHTPAALLLGENPGIYCIGFWVALTAGLDVLRKIKSFAPTGI